MKTLSLILVFTFLYSITYILYAQSPADCQYNLVNTIYYNIETQLGNSYANPSFPLAFKDVSYDLDETKPETNCNPDDDCINGEEAAAVLKYDVYYPHHLEHNYAVKLPAIILFHPGGFEECTDKNQPLMLILCQQLALRGYVVFNVEYRRGRKKDPIKTYTSVQQQLAAYRGCQDARGAIRSIIKRQQNHPNSDTYQIDITKIFVGGASAGGLISLNATWYTNQMVYDAFPSVGANSIQDALGPIDADYYYGEPTISYKPNLLGVMVLWSGMPIPFSYGTHQSDFFNNAPIKPLIAFHGYADDVFPFSINEAQIVNFSLALPPHAPYNSESGCLRNSPYALEGDPATPDLINASTLNMYTILRNEAPTMPTELYVDCTKTWIRCKRSKL